jgi:hypothetical protein
MSREQRPDRASCFYYSPFLINFRKNRNTPKLIWV